MSKNSSNEAKTSAIPDSEGSVSRAGTSKYPLHEKLRAHEREANTLSGFLDFIQERGWLLAEYSTNTDADLFERLFPIQERPEQIIGAYLGIDPKALSAEKDAMYAEAWGELVGDVRVK